MKKINVSKLEENLKRTINRDISEGNIIGAVVRVNQNHQTVFEGEFGSSKVGETEPLRKDTVFRMASMTKPITVVAVMMLVERGLLSLDGLLETYLPEFRDFHILDCDEEGRVIDKGVSKTKVNIFHLLTHSSGLCNGKIGEYYISRITANDKLTLDSAVKYYSNTGLAFEPFTKSQYNGQIAFDILAKVVEVVTGQDYEEFLQENIFKPCQMKDTTFVPSKEQWARVIQMHNKIDGKPCAVKMNENCVYGDCPTTHYLAGAGLISTISDYSNFAEMLLNNGRFGDNQLLSPETIQTIVTPYIDLGVPPYNQEWGLGMRVITGEDYELLPVGAYGWSGAYGTHFWVDPINQITAIYMKNSLYDGGSGAITARNFENDVFNSLE